MVQDCPVCGLVNPPDAQQCDCGYDFSSRNVQRSNLTDKDLAQLEDNARNPRVVPVPGGWVTAILLNAIINGTNEYGMIGLVASSFIATVASSIYQGGFGAFLVALGPSCVVCDLIVRLFVIRCSLLDVRLGPRFALFPLWLFGLFWLAAAGSIAIALNQ